MEMWGKFLGDKSRFAIGIDFRPDPDDGEGTTPEDSGSWGTFALWVGGANLCAHYEEGELIDAVHWYVLPLLEWFAENWEPLFHEERLPFSDDAPNGATHFQQKQRTPLGLSDEDALAYDERLYEWRQRHSIQACREGGIFPDITLRRWRELVEVSWDEIRLPGIPSGFTFVASGGTTRLPPPAVVEPLYHVLTDAAEFLSQRMPESKRLKSLVSRIESIRKTSREVRLAWMAGLGHRWKEAEKKWQHVRQKLSKLPKDAVAALMHSPLDSEVVLGSCEASLMFGSVSPDITAKDAVVLASKLVDLFDERGDRSKIGSLAGEVPLTSGETPPWDEGYRLAMAAHQTIADLGLYSGGVVDVVRILSELGIRTDQISLQDESIRAVAVAGPHHRTCILMNRRHHSFDHPVRERFTLAHELCHLLYDRAYGTHLAIASGPWAPEQLESRANAFAAMFLMPTRLVEATMNKLTKPVGSVADVEAVASALQTSFRATVEHLCNLGYISGADRDRLKEEHDERTAERN